MCEMCEPANLNGVFDLDGVTYQFSITTSEIDNNRIAKNGVSLETIQLAILVKIKDLIIAKIIKKPKDNIIIVNNIQSKFLEKPIKFLGINIDSSL